MKGVKTYSFYPIDSRMYVMTENNKACIVDPCESDEMEQLLKEEQVDEITVILTHEHYDHISGVNRLREICKKVSVICSGACEEGIADPHKNLSAYYEILFSAKDETTREYVRSMNVPPYSCRADRTFEGEMHLFWESHSLYLKETRGHSQGSICILLDDEILFSGDTLVTGYDTVLRLPGGSKKDFSSSALPFLRGLDKEIMVCPGHGEMQRLKEYDVPALDFMEKM